MGMEIVLDIPNGTPITSVKWKLVSVRLESVLISIENWCTVCAKCTIGSEISWAHLIVLLCDVA
jgi:hypothetical protein